MALRFLDKKTHPFYFVNEAGERTRYVLIYGDEVDTDVVSNSNLYRPRTPPPLRGGLKPCGLAPIPAPGFPR